MHLREDALEDAEELLLLGESQEGEGTGEASVTAQREEIALTDDDLVGLETPSPELVISVPLPKPRRARSAPSLVTAPTRVEHDLVRWNAGDDYAEGTSDLEAGSEPTRLQDPRVVERLRAELRRK
jgi:hypothetical protein